MFGFGTKKATLLAPFDGEVIPVADVPDAAFATGMLGVGFAIIPLADIADFDVHAPVSGTITTVFPTRHAIGLRTDDGLEILVHVGLDTVELNGEGFHAEVTQGDNVTAGQAMLHIDAATVRATGKKLITPVVMINKKEIKSIAISARAASAGQEVCEVVMH